MRVLHNLPIYSLLTAYHYVSVHTLAVRWPMTTLLSPPKIPPQKTPWTISYSDFFKRLMAVVVFSCCCLNRMRCKTVRRTLIMFTVIEWTKKPSQKIYSNTNVINSYSCHFYKNRGKRRSTISEEHRQIISTRAWGTAVKIKMLQRAICFQYSLITVPDLYIPISIWFEISGCV